ncbi:MAG: acetyl-CoA carboxylase biotin carboxyl carrier protein subunit [Anaerolineae bacterium]|nr:acetyl-CoA carboxylase biotin carboxyl carrier protein subunit [Anaerolineae bacterium]
MKRELTLTLDDIAYPITASAKAITVNDRDYAVEVLEDQTVLVDGIAYDVKVDGDTVTADGTSYSVQVTGMKRTAPARTGAKSSSSRRKSSGANSNAVTAIMPGRIIRVLVTPGQEVNSGDPVCILEAMKMENELRASQAGVVDSVNVDPGDAVDKGEVLVTFK